jgi:TonB-dependent SusC/RagA subfamily outer membrane receptor
MKRTILFLSFCVFMTGILSAQQRLESPRKVNVNQPLVLVDNLETSLNHLIINANTIEKIEVLKDSASVKSYGDKGKNGVILIFTKPNCELNKLDAILDKFHIAASDRQLGVCVDKVLIKDTSKLLIDATEVEKIEITTERIWNYPSEQPTGEKYINIITRSSMNPKSGSQIHIR